ncbi:hypothetical protein MNB_ARC-1_724 [hydrothermal vent metagenome]|uniref:PAS domain-containing protein n=1 Tax=hydrothermal vent metagenome TaxID=652676 RepID=A0A3B1DSJ7_9ZZZZ
MLNDSFYSSFIEHDLNPFILFDSKGKIEDFNKEAELLLNVARPKELYELAIANASINYGFNQKFISLKYERYSYYAILVGYINDSKIAIMLYKSVSIKQPLLPNNDVELINIFRLIELSKTTILLQHDIKIDEHYDISIPDIKINIKYFLLVLSKCFELFKNEHHLQLKVYIKIGEYELIKEKKHQIVSIEFTSKNKHKIPKELEYQASKACMHLFIDDKKIILDFPMIVS